MYLKARLYKIYHDRFYRELELEDDEDEKKITFYKAEIIDNHLHVKDRKYSNNFIKIMEIQPKHLLQNKGPGNCLCQYLKEEQKCDSCSQLVEDWKIYNAINEVETIPLQGLDIGKDKQVSVGQITKDQKKQLQ